MTNIAAITVENARLWQIAKIVPKPISAGGSRGKIIDKIDCF
jgi:hypothetical protein